MRPTGVFELASIGAVAIDAILAVTPFVFDQVYCVAETAALKSLAWSGPATVLNVLYWSQNGLVATGLSVSAPGSCQLFSALTPTPFRLCGVGLAGIRV